ncbi:hypothetical protein DFH27DRAFT_162909 [Peziza echinospora]|nr:hypothetical protein DFH27DRAFT_162909 [Peziza echinospora]
MPGAPATAGSSCPSLKPHIKSPSNSDGDLQFPWYGCMYVYDIPSHASALGNHTSTTATTTLEDQTDGTVPQNRRKIPRNCSRPARRYFLQSHRSSATIRSTQWNNGRHSGSVDAGAAAVCGRFAQPGAAHTAAACKAALLSKTSSCYLSCRPSKKKCACFFPQAEPCLPRLTHPFNPSPPHIRLLCPKYPEHLRNPPSLRAAPPLPLAMGTALASTLAINPGKAD